MIKYRQILAVGWTEKTGKTREILKTMWNTTECESNSVTTVVITEQGDVICDNLPRLRGTTTLYRIKSDFQTQLINISSLI